MRRLRTIAIAAALATFCSTAAAKEIAAVSICGEDGCRAVADKRLLPLLAEGGLQHRAPAEPAEHFVVRARVDHEGATAYRFKTIVLPDAGLVRGDDGAWMQLSYAAQNAYTKLTRGRDALPASAMAADALADPRPPVAQPAAPDGSGSPWPWPWIAAAAVLAGALVLARRGVRYARLRH